MTDLIQKYTRRYSAAEMALKKPGSPQFFIPSPQQADFIHWVATGKGSCVLEAVAGAGKSTTLVEAVRYMRGYIFLGAYNKSAGQDLDAKLANAELKGRSDIKVRAGTMHSAGFSGWRYVAKDVKINENKTGDIVKGWIARLDPKTQQGEIDRLWLLMSFITKTVSLAKQSGFGVLQPMEDMHAWYSMAEHYDLESELAENGPGLAEGLAASLQALKEGIKQDYEWIDFDDMIFCPLFHNVRLFQQDWVLIDEAQDTNASRRALAKKMLRPGGRLVAVGDKHQAIYGFTGADSDALDLIREEHSAISLPLTVTYRCPKAVVRRAQEWVSHIQAHESAPEGVCTSMSAKTLFNKERVGNQLHYTDLTAADVILCRNSKPLVELAYFFIRNNMACQVEGREIGSGLVKLCTRWKIRTLAQLRANLKTWGEREKQKWLAKGKEQQAQGVEDKVETLFLLIERLQEEGKQEISDLVKFITDLFGDVKPGEKPRVLTLASGHKSKGREWKRVFWLGRNAYQPSPWARQEWQKQQEDNLMYVMATRAEAELIELMVA